MPWRPIVRVLKRSHLEHSGPTLIVFVAGATLLSLVALFGVAYVAGFHAVWHRFSGAQPAWFALAFAAEIVAYLGYIMAYRDVARVEEGPALETRDTAALVAAGFGPFIAQGGFAVDLHAFKTLGESDREARVRVLGLGALEYAILAPATCMAALALIGLGDHKPSWGVTFPWAIAVPLGALAAFVAVEHRQRLQGPSRARQVLGHALESVYVVRCLFHREHWGAPAGAALYWFGDVLCLWACLQAFHAGSPGVTRLIVGYATGYALTRRTLPFAGAGAVEALLPFALSWVDFPLAAALWGVLYYRIFNLWLPVVPAVFGLRSLRAWRPPSKRRRQG